MDTRKVNCEEVFQSNEISHTPVILNFQNGILNEGSLKAVEYFELKDNKKKQNISALVSSNRNSYSGPVLENMLTNTYIVVRNKITNKARIIQTNEALLINDIYNEKKDVLLNFDNTLLDKLMIKNFAGRKANVAYERTERMKVNVDIAKEQLDKTIENVNTDKSHIKKNSFDIELIRPKFNEEAKEIENVYSITDIISKELLDSLNDECHSILKHNIEEIPIESEFLKQKLMKIKESKNSESVENFTIIKACLYLDGLRNLIKSRQRALNKIELSKITRKVEDHIKDNFCDPNGRTKIKSAFSTDKALCYYITLMILIDENYSVSILTLLSELNIPKPKIAKYLRIVNAKAKIGTNLYKLQLPGAINLKASMIPPKSGKRGL